VRWVGFEVSQSVFFLVWWRRENVVPIHKLVSLFFFFHFSGWMRYVGVLDIYAYSISLSFFSWLCMWFLHWCVYLGYIKNYHHSSECGVWAFYGSFCFCIGMVYVGWMD